MPRTPLGPCQDICPLARCSRLLPPAPAGEAQHPPRLAICCGERDRAPTVICFGVGAAGPLLNCFWHCSRPPAPIPFGWAFLNLRVELCSPFASMFGALRPGSVVIAPSFGIGLPCRVPLLIFLFHHLTRGCEDANPARAPPRRPRSDPTRGKPSIVFPDWVLTSPGPNEKGPPCPVSRLLGAPHARNTEPVPLGGSDRGGRGAVAESLQVLA